MTTTLSVRIDSRDKEALEAHGKRLGVKSFLAAEAIAAFVEAESWQLDEIQKGLSELDEAAVSAQGCCELASFVGSQARTEGASGVNIVWSPRAIEHLEHLRAYIAQDNPKAANRVAAALLDAVERLAERPNWAVLVGSPGRGNWSCQAHRMRFLTDCKATVSKSSQSSTADRNGRSVCELVDPASPVGLDASGWAGLVDGSGRRDSNSGPCAQGRANPNISFGRGIAIVDARGTLRQMRRNAGTNLLQHHKSLASEPWPRSRVLKTSASSLRDCLALGLSRCRFLLHHP